jgi:hypothetical protein
MTVIRFSLRRNEAQQEDGDSRFDARLDALSQAQDKAAQPARSVFRSVRTPQTPREA